MFSVLTNSVQRSQRQTQRIPAFSSGDRGWRTLSRRIEERHDLSAQWFDVDYIEMLDVYARPGAARRGSFQTTHRRSLGCVIHRDVVVRLKETHLPDFFRAYPGSSYVRHRPG